MWIGNNSPFNMTGFNLMYLEGALGLVKYGGLNYGFGCGRSGRRDKIKNIV